MKQVKALRDGRPYSPRLGARHSMPSPLAYFVYAGLSSMQSLDSLCVVGIIIFT